MDSFKQVASTIPGRIIRVLLGMVIITLGILKVGGVLGVILTVIGVVPMAAGIFNFCVIGYFDKNTGNK